MKTRELTRIALMGTILYVVFQAFSDILYLEMITFTILAFSQVFTRRETVLSCLLFAAVHLLLHGIMFWNIAYLIIFPTYGLLFSASRGLLDRHPGFVPFYGAFFSFLTGQLVDLPFLLLSDTVTVLYMIMGLKTSLIQGCLTFLTLLFLFEPIKKVLLQIERRMMR